MNVEEFAEKIRTNSDVVVFTGAGISTESGIPDFRSPGGIWTRYRPVTFQEYMSSEASRIEAWKRRLDGWDQYRSAKPNVGHYFVNTLNVKDKLIGLITQNVSNRKIICMSCSKEFDPEPIIRQLVGDFASPKCDTCGGILKAATVSFGQAMPEEAMRTAHEWTECAEVFIVMGSSLQVQPAASFPAIAKQNGALLAIINREETPLDEYADFVHRGAIGEFCGRFGEMIADG